MSDFGDMSYDMDDPDMLYDPFGGETRPRIDQDGGLDVSDDVVESEGGPGPDQTRQNSSLDWELEYLDKSIIYPNLQVTQSILHPKELRRTKSGDIDCFRVLTKVFRKSSFKGKQKEVMDAAVLGADVLVVAPTGMGKSMCFQVPAVAERHGVTIVVSPLLSLMKDQVAKLRHINVPVYAFTSETSKEERDEIIKDLKSGHPKARLLYITPEKLCSSETNQLIAKVHAQGELNRLVIDEAHCISEWGTDFRQEYRKLGLFRDRFPSVPIMALTASATPVVQDDIVSSLKMSRDHLFKVVHPFNRANLFYEVQYHSPTTNVLEAVSDYILKLYKRRGAPSTGIVYCRTRQGCDEMSQHLRSRGIGSRPYHRGLPPKTLDKTLAEWESEDSGVHVVCATVAFGMGIDKADVRYVIHADLPKSFEGYYQETGRAGRDGLPAKCVIFYSREDAVRVQKFVLASSNRTAGSTGQSNDNTVGKHAEKSLVALIKFAESTSVCRHVAICRFFGETIDTSNEVVAKAYCDRFCDVCKYPEKTRERKKMLASEDYISTQKTRLEEEVGDIEEETPLERPRVKLPGFRMASSLPKQQLLSRQLNEAKEGAVAISSLNNSVGGVGNQKLKVGLARNLAVQSDHPRSGLTHITRPFRPPTFKVPVVPAPQSSAAGEETLPSLAPPIDITGSSMLDPIGVVPSTTEVVDVESFERDVGYDIPNGTDNRSALPRARATDANNELQKENRTKLTVNGNPLGVKKREVLYPAGGPKKEKMQEDPASDGEVEDLEAVVMRARKSVLEDECDGLPDMVEDDDIELEAAFSQKIPVSIREKSIQRLRKAIWSGFTRGVAGDNIDFVWDRLHFKGRTMNEDTRNSLCFHIAKELEFYVFGLCCTTTGYEQRIDEQLRGIKEAFGPDARAKAAWVDKSLRMEDERDEDLELASEFVEFLHSILGRWRRKRR